MHIRCHPHLKKKKKEPEYDVFDWGIRYRPGKKPQNNDKPVKWVDKEDLIKRGMTDVWEEIQKIREIQKRKQKKKNL